MRNARPVSVVPRHTTAPAAKVAEHSLEAVERVDQGVLLGLARSNLGRRPLDQVAAPDDVAAARTRAVRVLQVPVHGSLKDALEAGGLRVEISSHQGVNKGGNVGEPHDLLPGSVSAVGEVGDVPHGEEEARSPDPECAGGGHNTRGPRDGIDCLLQNAGYVALLESR